MKVQKSYNETSYIIKIQLKAVHNNVLNRSG
jgi:hypothetical protein